MISASLEPRPWPRRRWWGMVALVFIGQLLLIFWLGSRTPIRPHLPTGALTLHLGGRISSELQALNDPTLFTLPHSRGGFEPTPPRTPRAEARSFVWPAPTNQPLWPLDRLGVAFNRRIETPDFTVPQLPPRPEATPTLPDPVPLALSAPQSVLQVEGDLARRRLLAPVELKSWPNPDLLKNSVVRIVVDAQGRPVSVTLLSTCGLPAADQYALDQAWAARFEPAHRDPPESTATPTAHLSSGKMVFQWHTLPVQLPTPPAANP